MTITIHGPAASSYVRTARIICLEKGLAHTLEPLDFGSAAHEQLHPWKRVPILVHGDLTLIETSAIARYLEDIGSGPSLIPAHPAQRARMEQWISTINCYLYDSLVRNYAFKYIGPKLRGQEPDLEAVRAGVPTMQRDIARLDAAYAANRYVAGETLSLADLFVAPIVATVAAFPEGRAALDASPHLGRAFGELAQRESFVVVHAGLGR